AHTRQESKEAQTTSTTRLR
ncbi:hypothetical protein CCACVL1_15955, partial [Corchorus capsularis]